MKLALLALSAAALLSAADTKLGKPLTLKEALPVATVASSPDDYVGKTVQVKGKVSEVCEMMGCWMTLTNDAGQMVRVQVEHGDLVFPKDSPGKTAVAEGKFEKEELTREQAIARAKEEAEEKGKKFDPESVKGPMKVYHLQATGAVVQSN